MLADLVVLRRTGLPGEPRTQPRHGRGRRRGTASSRSGPRTSRGLVGPGHRGRGRRRWASLPGFQDAHVHPVARGAPPRGAGSTTTSARTPTSPGSAPTRTPTRDEAWIIGGGWAMESFPGGTPDPADSRRVVPDRPVPRQPGPPRRLGQQPRPRARRDRPADPGPRRRPDRARRRRRARPAPSTRGPPTLVETGSPPPGPRGRSSPGCSRRRSYLHSLGITAWQDAMSALTPAGTTSTAYLSRAADGRLTARVVGGAVVGPGPGPRTGRRPARPAGRRASAERFCARRTREDHAGRRHGELHRRAARAVPATGAAAAPPTAACRFIDPEQLAGVRHRARRGTASRSTSTRSATGRCARPSTPSRRPGPRTVRATTATTSPTSRWSTPRTSPGSPALGVDARTSRRSGPSTSRRWTS